MVRNYVTDDSYNVEFPENTLAFFAVCENSLKMQRRKLTLSISAQCHLTTANKPNQS